MLIVDDDESVRDYLRLILEDAGYVVVAFPHGQLALEYLGHATVDIILLDLMMPVLDGWQTAAAIQGDVKLRAIPIIVFSSVGDAEPPGVAATLVKPAGLDEVLPVIERLLLRNRVRTPERRRNPRYRASFDLVTKASSGTISTTTRDVSSSGVAFEFVSAKPPQIGERMILSVDLAMHGVARVEAEVKHVVAIDGGWRVGAQLIAFRDNAGGFAEQVSLLAISTTPCRD